MSFRNTVHSKYILGRKDKSRPVKSILVEDDAAGRVRCESDEEAEDGYECEKSTE